MKIALTHSLARRNKSTVWDDTRLLQTGKESSRMLQNKSNIYYKISKKRLIFYQMYKTKGAATEIRQILH